MGFTGSCACGYIKYECDVEPLAKLICHCSDCRKSTGSAFAVVVVVPKADFRITNGNTKSFSYTADSGKLYTPHFCPECGSGIYGEPEAAPNIVSIRAGTLDDDRWNFDKIDTESFVKRRAKYLCAVDAPQNEDMPPM